MRLPYTQTEVEIAAQAARVRREKGDDLILGDGFVITDGPSLFKAAKDGAIFFCSPHILSCAFLFVKCNAGKGLFGRQHAVFASFIGDPRSDEWVAGTAFKSWGLAVTSTGNIFRHQRSILGTQGEAHPPRRANAFGEVPPHQISPKPTESVGELKCRLASLSRKLDQVKARD